MTTISKGNGVVLVNVFKVAPENQQKLIDVLAEATEQVMRHQPGFISANIHRGLDGTRVANYAQWRSREDFERMLGDPKAREHMGVAGSIAAPDFALYEVAFIDEKAAGA